MGLKRLRFELRMKLAAEIPGMIRHFADFDIHAIRSLAGQTEAMPCKRLFKLAIEFVAVAMALADLRCAIGLLGKTSRSEKTRVGAEPHGSAKLIHAEKLTEFEDYAMGRGGIEFGRIGVGETAHIARKLDDHGLHAKANAEIGDFIFARTSNRIQHSLNAALAKAAGDENSIEAAQKFAAVRPFHAFRFDPFDIYSRLVRDAGVQQSLFQALLGIFVFDILADQSDADFACRIMHAVQHVHPARKIARRSVDVQHTQNAFIYALFGEN